MNNLDSFISRADPAASVTIVSVDASEVEAKFRDLSARSGIITKRRYAGIGLGAICIGLAIAGVLTIGGPSGSPAAATLNRLASVTVQNSTALAPGQFVHTEYQSEIEVLVQSGSEPPATASFPERIQTWVSQQPTQGTIVADPTGPLSFPSAADKQAWQTSPLSPHWTTPPTIQSNYPATPYDVSALPTDPSALRGLLATGRTGLVQIDSVGGPDPTFSRAAMLLFNPSTSAAPQLQAALYKVLTSLPQVAVSQGEDHLHRAGVVISDSRFQNVPVLIVDSSSGRPMEFQLPISVNTDASSPKPDGVFVSAAIWTDVVSASVVDSTAH